MTDEKNSISAQQKELDEVNAQLKELVDVDRRVITRKETISFMLYDGSSGFNIDGHKELFVNGTLQIGLKRQSLYNVIGGIWDIVDDFAVSAIIEKTRTRWGKFVPYLFLGGLPYALVCSLYWLLPNFFSDSVIADQNAMSKFVAYMAVDMLIEFLGNFRNVAVGGYLSTITPYPSDRRRLLSVSSYCKIIYSRIPDLIVEFMLDFIQHGIIKSADKASGINKALMTMGPATSLISGAIVTWYSTMAKERVHQKVEAPKLRDSIRIVFSNRPVLMYMLSNALGSFGTGFSTNDYYRTVLFMTTFETFAGIPSFFFQPIGFSKYNVLAAKFSTKSLFMISQVFAKAFYIPLWFYGRFLHTKDGKYFFQGIWPMLPVTAVWECIYATFWGVKSISGTEIGNECNDYIEWKCGYRNEATLAAASTLICKIPGRINGILEPLYKDWIGYDITAYNNGKEQPIAAQKWIFAMCTLITALLVATSMIPMFWYNIDKDMRDRMYCELNERRVANAERINREHEAEVAAATE